MSQSIRIYVGTYSQEIYVYRMNLETGQLTSESQIEEVENPSFLSLDPQNCFLYAVNETGNYQGQESGSVSAFAIDSQSGRLTFLNRQSTHGTSPCHLSVDATGQCVLVANYGTGSVAAYPIQSDGHLGEASAVVQHQGSSVNPQRQTSPHAHSIMISPDNRHAFVPDLGMDKVMIYQLDLATGQLIANDQPSVAIEQGQGPRHFDFHPGQEYAYVINEIGSTVTTFEYNPEAGALDPVQTISTLPDDFEGSSSCADIHVSADGKFVYGSNRGHDSIVIYAVDPDSGQLTYVGHESTRGQSPRNFGIDPTGTYLLAANHGSNNIFVFRIDPETGTLDYTGYSAEVPTPVCLKMVQVEE